MVAATSMNDPAFAASDIASFLDHMSPEIFSFFEYSSSCGGEALRVPMEPLVGLMRHPRVVEACAALPGQPTMIDTHHDIPGAGLSLNLTPKDHTQGDTEIAPPCRAKYCIRHLP